jgi:hypothetical protein
LVNIERQVRSPSKKLATLALAIAVIAFVVIGIVVEFVFLPKASSSASRTTTPSEPVNAAVNRWVADLNSRNVTGLADSYAENATVNWTGLASGFAGTYAGRGNITILYGSTTGKESLVNASITNYNQNDIGPSDANVTFVLNMTGNNAVTGHFAILLNASQRWDYAGGHWQILKENWDYKVFNIQYPCCGTTFPQWAALKSGMNPDLVSEKSFEWHAGPMWARPCTRS